MFLHIGVLLIGVTLKKRWSFQILSERLGGPSFSIEPASLFVASWQGRLWNAVNGRLSWNTVHDSRRAIQRVEGEFSREVG